MNNRISICTILLVLLSAEAWAQGQTSNTDRANRYYNLGNEHESAKEYALAIGYYTEALEIDPRHKGAYFSRACVYAHELKQYDKAIDDLTSLLALNPTCYSALFNRGMYYESLRKYDLAIADYTQALAPTTDFSRVAGTPEEYRAHAYHYRGRAYQWYKNEHAKAVADFTEALRLDPDIEMVHYHRGLSYHSLQRYDKAHRDFQTACQRDPDYPNLMIAWAWQLATCPDQTYRDGEKAHKLAAAAVERFKTPRHLDVLAAALAERGRFTDAVETIDSGIALLNGQDRELKQAMTDRRELYATMQPFREQVR